MTDFLVAGFMLSVAALILVRQFARTREIVGRNEAVRRMLEKPAGGDAR